MIICESEFERPDSKDPRYSQHEVDYYAWIPPHPDVPNHRLSLRKNLETGKYEVYRRFHSQTVVSRKGRTLSMRMMMITGKDKGSEQVVFSSADLKEAVEFACAEYKRFHGSDDHKDQICEHKHPVYSRWCTK